MLPSPEPEKSAQYERGDTVSAREVDTGAALFAKLGADPNAPIDEEEALRIRYGALLQFTLPTYLTS
jgi:hypothetical protein